MESLAYLGAGGLCIAAIACLANQKTARLGGLLPAMYERNVSPTAHHLQPSALLYTHTHYRHNHTTSPLRCRQLPGPDRCGGRPGGHRGRRVT